MSKSYDEFDDLLDDEFDDDDDDDILDDDDDDDDDIKSTEYEDSSIDDFIMLHILGIL